MQLNHSFFECGLKLSYSLNNVQFREELFKKTGIGLNYAFSDISSDNKTRIGMKFSHKGDPMSNVIIHFLKIREEINDSNVEVMRDIVKNVKAMLNSFVNDEGQDKCGKIVCNLNEACFCIRDLITTYYRKFVKDTDIHFEAIRVGNLCSFILYKEKENMHNFAISFEVKKATNIKQMEIILEALYSFCKIYFPKINF